jgi:hypothetical protein
MPHLTSERHALLRLMAAHFAKLNLIIHSPRDVFFDHFALVLVHVQLTALRRHDVFAGKEPAEVGAAVASVLRHVIALLGSPPLASDRVHSHMRFAQRKLTGPLFARPGKGSTNTVKEPWEYDRRARGPLVPPLADVVIPPIESLAPPPGAQGGGFPAILPVADGPVSSLTAMMTGRAAPAAPGAPKLGGWRQMKGMVQVHAMQKHLDKAAKAKRDHAASTGQLWGGARPYRPARMLCDLTHHTPLIAIFQGADPEKVLETTEFEVPEGRTGYGRQAGGMPRSEAPRGSILRQSVPGLGGKSRLGGAASFQALQPTAMVERSRQRVAQYEQGRKAEETTMLIFDRALESKLEELDRQMDGKLHLPRTQLADYGLELAEKALHPLHF